MRAWFFTVGLLKNNDRLVALCTYGFSTLFTWYSTLLCYLSEGGKRSVVTQGWSQAQLAAEFHTPQSNVSKLLKKHVITGEVKTQPKRLHQQHTGTCWHLGLIPLEDDSFSRMIMAMHVLYVL